MTLAQVFSCEFCEISKNTFFTEHLWWLLLVIDVRQGSKYASATHLKNSCCPPPVSSVLIRKSLKKLLYFVWICFCTLRWLVNIKLAFTEKLFYNLTILIKIWNLYLDKDPVFLRNQVICLKSWKLWRASTTIGCNVSFAEILHTFPAWRYSQGKKYVLLNSVQEIIGIEAFAGSDVFRMFTQSVMFHTFHCHILKSKYLWKRWFIKLTENERLLLSAPFMGKFKLVFV